MYQYETIKLEKGMYHLTNKSFLQALEEADPSVQYVNSPLAGLDAYERQLKRFNIHISGINCDRVEKFFTTTESAVLFPEFVRRAVMQGMEKSVLSEIVATVSKCESNRYQGCELTDTVAYTPTTAGSALPVSSILESSSVITLQKYGRNIQASYEAVRQQRLDVFAIMLRRVGKRLADSLVTQAMITLKLAANTTANKITKAGSTLAYSDLARLYGKFTTFDMRVMLASPSVVADILVMNQMMETSSQDVREIRLPFGTKLINCAQLDDNTILGLDNEFALEQIQSSDIVLETDKLISNQLDSITVSVNISFRTLMDNTVKMLDIS
ncbi:MAG: hypothetical protein IJJ69_01255 [Oscillospiraceae bacterium]|nr:hypothetical protein [Oscillospiraceae bacterium]